MKLCIVTLFWCQFSISCTVKSGQWEYYVHSVLLVNKKFVCKRTRVITSRSSFLSILMSSNFFRSSSTLRRLSSSLQFMYNTVHDTFTVWGYIHIMITSYFGVNNLSVHVKTCVSCPEAGLSSFALLLLQKRDSDMCSSPSAQPTAHLSHLTQTAYWIIMRCRINK